ncbi:uncharacterized protein [Diabrotica undecimpunctata]|uniref:uncharacterized protein n=1 Tax=Diabrotica undecimpunctata TaxID=50387 RepID=UPI003B633F00
MWYYESHRFRITGRKVLELDTIPDNKHLSNEEQQVEEHFINTVQRDTSGRFIVSVPLKEPISRLGNSKDIAMKQFYSLERKLAVNPQLKKLYSDFMKEYEELNHMTWFTPSDTQITYYSPHHGVLKEESDTTKLRVVFNSSTLSSSGHSYNSIQMVGPVVQDELYSIMLRFRQHNIVICGDICKMYRQVMVHKRFHLLQLIVWRNNPNEELQTYALNRVVYGTASGPYLATRCLVQLGIENEKSNPEAARVIKNDFFVDDLITGADSLNQGIILCQQIDDILKSGGFHLRKWKSNNLEVFTNIQHTQEFDEFYFGFSEASKVLGLYWSANKDVFSIKVVLPQVTKFTKRLILSEIAKIFDLLGLISPLFIKAKILLQSLWYLNLSWDQEVPLDIRNKWISIGTDLKELNSLQIPRHVVCMDRVHVEIHGFADASQSAYGACMYVRSTDSNNTIQTSLLTSKTRVAPLKTISIPRLELCAALLLAELFQKVVKSLTISIDDYYLWSDSTVTLAWIKTSPHMLQVFVGNRIDQIQSLTNVDKWRYVPTATNAADILT